MVVSPGERRQHQVPASRFRGRRRHTLLWGLQSQSHRAKRQIVDFFIYLNKILSIVSPTFYVYISAVHSRASGLKLARTRNACHEIPRDWPAL